MAVFNPPLPLKSPFLLEYSKRIYPYISVHNSRLFFHIPNCTLFEICSTYSVRSKTAKRNPQKKKYPRRFSPLGLCLCNQLISSVYNRLNYLRIIQFLSDLANLHLLNLYSSVLTSIPFLSFQFRLSFISLASIKDFRTIYTTYSFKIFIKKSTQLLPDALSKIFNFYIFYF